MSNDGNSWWPCVYYCCRKNLPTTKAQQLNINMRRCPVCQNPLTERLTFCPRCMSKLDNSPQTDNNNVIEPELVNPVSSSQNYSDIPYLHTSNQQFHKVVFTTFSQGSIYKNGCTPLLITLGLALGVFLVYGFLAMLGFLFFSTVLSILTFMFTIFQLLNRQNINVWILYIGNWSLSLLVTAWLS